MAYVSTRTQKNIIQELITLATKVIANFVLYAPACILLGFVNFLRGCVCTAAMHRARGRKNSVTAIFAVKMQFLRGASWLHTPTKRVQSFRRSQFPHVSSWKNATRRNNMYDDGLLAAAAASFPSPPTQTLCYACLLALRMALARLQRGGPEGVKC